MFKIFLGKGIPHPASLFFFLFFFNFSMESNKLSILSLNCWGLYVVSKKRKFRLNAIAEAIQQASYDIVTLQEVWVHDDYKKLKSCVSTKLPHAKYFYSGALGSGLVILSRFPIIQTSYYQYTLAGRPLKVFHGDYYVGKGCASACLEHPIVGIIQVFTTHLHAGYGKSDEYQGHRISESWELANLIRSASAQGRQVIVTGDFNSTPTTYNYRLLIEHAFMTDSWMEVNKQDSDVLSNQQTMENNDTEDAFIQLFGVTCNSSSNTWSKHFNHHPQRQKQPHSAKGNRLDYIFYRRSPQLWCSESCVVMTERIPGTDMSYSDHFGVQSNFVIGRENMDRSTTGSLTTGNNDHHKQQHSMTPTTAMISHPTFTNLDLTTVQELILLLQVDQQKIAQTARRFLQCFVALVALVLILYIAMVVVPYRVVTTTPIPRYDSDNLLIVWLLPFLVGIPLIVCSVLAMVCLLVGFVFGYGEKQAMHQFVTDLQTLLHGIQLRNRGLSTNSMDSQ
ncbi:Endonuclease/exonuclease/phosphatase [Chlamydoabsidia padenii]|nr:Endonuclease/exonuclease/phosphatase [Chlamydoabsidia padenii]